MPWLFTLASIAACLGTWALARYVGRERRQECSRSPWVTAGLVVLTLCVGVGAGLFGPLGVVAAVAPSSTSYEDVLPVWLFTLPGVPVLLALAVVHAVRNG